MCWRRAGFDALGVESLPTPARMVSDAFLRNVAEKNWSMFRLLDAAEFDAGLQALEAVRGRVFDAPAAGSSLVWLCKPAGEGDPIRRPS